MANPNPAGALASSAGVRTTAVAALRAQLPSGATLASSVDGAFPPSLDNGVLVGLVVAIAAIAYWYRRIL